MMNKDEYINALDKIKAPDELKQKILNSKKQGVKKKKANLYKIAAAAAACIVLVAAIVPIFADSKLAYGSKSDGAVNNGYGYTEDMEFQENMDMSSGTASSFTLTSQNQSTNINANRKIVKNATLYVETKNLTEFIEKINGKINDFGGYSESVNINSYSSGRADLVLRIPAENLDGFINAVDEAATIQSKNISANDITDTYTDVKSQIKALETEEAALLKILEKCETVSDTIETQGRLSEVRGELDSLKGRMANLDSQVNYSTVTISVSEESRIVKSDDSFLSRLKVKFEDSLYNIASFFEALAVNLLGGILYIAIAGAAAAIIIIIIKKKKRNK